MIPYLTNKRRSQKGAYMIWIVFLTPVLVGLLAFSVDVGMIYDEKHQAQTNADALALAGINVVGRTFNASLTPKQKADAVMAAVREMAARQSPKIADSALTITYCPKGSELSAAGFSGAGRCLNLPASSTPPASYARIASPSANYPLASEAVGGTDADSSAYVHVKVTANNTNYFSRFLKIINMPPVSAEAMARKREQLGGCTAYYQPLKAGPSTDPQTIMLRDGSHLSVTVGGILILDDPNNALSSSGTGNTVSAPWIKVVSDQRNVQQISYYCEADCPEYGIDPTTLPNYLQNPAPPTVVPINCNDSAYTDTADNCDCYPQGDPQCNVYVNCEVNASNYTSKTLRPGTYCGGLMVSNVGTAGSPVTLFQPTVSNDVYVLKSRDANPSDYQNKLGRAGYLNVSYSHIQAGAGPVVNGGVYFYAPEPVSNSSDFSIDLDNSSLRGYLRLWADHLQLRNSTLEYSMYTAGNNGCPGYSFILSLVQ